MYFLTNKIEYRFIYSITAGMTRDVTWGEGQKCNDSKKCTVLVIM